MSTGGPSGIPCWPSARRFQSDCPALHLLSWLIHSISPTPPVTRLPATCRTSSTRRPLAEAGAYRAAALLDSSTRSPMSPSRRPSAHPPLWTQQPPDPHWQQSISSLCSGCQSLAQSLSGRYHNGRRPLPLRRPAQIGAVEAAGGFGDGGRLRWRRRASQRCAGSSSARHPGHLQRPTVVPRLALASRYYCHTASAAATSEWTCPTTVTAASVWWGGAE